jgi:hypothetical protein
MITWLVAGIRLALHAGELLEGAIGGDAELIGFEEVVEDGDAEVGSGLIAIILGP